MAKTNEEQPRDEGSKRFVSSYAKEALHRLLRLVALAVRPDDPASLTQDEFNENATAVMKALGEPVPPSATAIYMRLNKKARAKKTWRQMIEEALDEERNVIQSLAATDRALPVYVDERVAFYAMRRAGEHLGKELGHALSRVDYATAQGQLLEQDRLLNRGRVLEHLMPNVSQLETLAGDAGWAGVCELAGYTPYEHVASVEAFDPLVMLAHFYDQHGLPSHYEILRKHAASFDIPIPDRTKYAELKEEFIAGRAARGLETPPAGPKPGEELTAEELAVIEALFEAAPKLHRKGHWRVLENTLDALAEYVELYGNKVPLRQLHYRTVYKSHDWPTPSGVTHCQKEHGIAGFQAMIERARKHAKAKGQAA